MAIGVKKLYKDETMKCIRTLSKNGIQLKTLFYSRHYSIRNPWILRQFKIISGQYSIVAFTQFQMIINVNEYKPCSMLAKLQYLEDFIYSSEFQLIFHLRVP